MFGWTVKYGPGAEAIYKQLKPSPQGHVNRLIAQIKKNPKVGVETDAGRVHTDGTILIRYTLLTAKKIININEINLAF